MSDEEPKGTKSQVTLPEYCKDCNQHYTMMN
jgi:hypothetical protein